MPKKKKVIKKITIKEITDAFYNGESVEKIMKMTELLAKQNEVPQTEYSKNNCFDK
jgi:hypothetical protein